MRYDLSSSPPGQKSDHRYNKRKIPAEPPAGDKTNKTKQTDIHQSISFCMTGCCSADHFSIFSMHPIIPYVDIPTIHPL
jgi:hypothetical protein